LAIDCLNLKGGVSMANNTNTYENTDLAFEMTLEEFTRFHGESGLFKNNDDKNYGNSPVRGEHETFMQFMKRGFDLLLTEANAIPVN